MSTVNVENNKNISTIVELYLSLSSLTQEKLDDTAKNIVQIICATFQEYLEEIDRISIPYKDITDIVYKNDNKSIRLQRGSIDSFREVSVEKAFDMYFADSLQGNQEEYEKCKNNFFHIYDKLLEHILLAEIQRDFIQEVVKRAEKSAENAEILAKNAEEVAQKAESIYQGMFTNYITILGVFVAITMTIFGGVHIINVIVTKSLLLPRTIIFLVSLTFLCIISILFFLARIIVFITKSHEYNIIPWFAVFCVICVLCVVCTMKSGTVLI